MPVVPPVTAAVLPLSRFQAGRAIVLWIGKCKDSQGINGKTELHKILVCSFPGDWVGISFLCDLFVLLLIHQKYLALRPLTISSRGRQELPRITIQISTVLKMITRRGRGSPRGRVTKRGQPDETPRVRGGNCTDSISTTNATRHGESQFIQTRDNIRH